MFGNGTSGGMALVQQALARVNRTLSIQAWLNEEGLRAQQVNIIRRYVNGQPDNFLTDGQITLLNLPTGSSGVLHQFSDNYCPSILDTTLDRIQLTGIEADDDIQQEWVDKTLDTNRLDQLQVDLHEAALRDGNAFLMVDAIAQPDNAPPLIRLTQEPAYDGYYGTVVMYETADSKKPVLAVKIWRVTSDKLTDTVRLNIYYPNRVERYSAFVGGGIRPYGSDVDIDALESQYQAERAAADAARRLTGEKTPVLPLKLDPSASPGLPPGPDDGLPSVIPWIMEGGMFSDADGVVHVHDGVVIKNADGSTTVNGEPIGVPIIHFRNKGNNIQTHGISELENVIPLQDLLNRTLYDMAATSALSAFGVRVMIGVQAPTSIQPGTMLSYFAQPENTGGQGVPSPEAIEWLKSIRIDQFEQADMVPYISQADWLKNEMFAVTNTPEMEDASANASGESLRQREVKLIGKVRRFEVRNGNSWEDTLRMCARVQQAFSTEKPPELGTLNAKWLSPEIRNDTADQANALQLYQAGLIDQRTMLNMIKDIYDWDAEDIDKIVAETERAKNAQMQAQLTAGDGQGAMDTLQRLGLSGGTNKPPANGAAPAPAQGGAVVDKPVTPAPPGQGQPKVSANGSQETPGA